MFVGGQKQRKSAEQPQPIDFSSRQVRYSTLISIAVPAGKKEKF